MEEKYCITILHSEEEKEKKATPIHLLTDEAGKGAEWI